jgi:hypothetical protein
MHPSLSTELRFGFGLTESEVRRLQDILRRDGEDLTLEQAWARAVELLSLFRMLLGPIPEDPGQDEVRTS